MTNDPASMLDGTEEPRARRAMAAANSGPFVASLELCKELFELSGWENEDGYVVHQKINPHTGKVLSERTITWGVSRAYINDQNRNEAKLIPAYDLGYLLRMLNKEVEFRLWGGGFDSEYLAYAMPSNDKLTFKADTPEDAACKLAIELFKANVLTRKG